MENLSFEKTPSYVFSSNRQFEEGETHISRIYDMSVLILMRKGILKFRENGVDISLKAGEYYIQRPFILQEGIYPSEKPNYYFIHFKGHYSNGGALPLRGTFDLDKIQKYIEELEALGESADKIEKEALFYKILISIKKNTGKDTTSEIIRKYISNNFYKKVNIKDISEIVYLSKNQIINVFKSTYGLTPYQYLIEVRLKKACEQILSTNNSIKTICYDVGFTDYSNFYKAFVEKYKMSPNDYKSKISSKQLPEDLYKMPDKESGYTIKD